VARTDGQKHSERGVNNKIVDLEKERRIDGYIRRIVELTGSDPELAKRTEEFLSNDPDDEVPE
jgi:hypothetical protein